MGEIGISVAGKIAEYLVDPIIRHARYVFYFNKFVCDLRKAKAELESTLQYIKEKEQEATINAQKIVQPVEKWLNDVKEVLEEEEKQEERVEASKSCFNVTLRYSVAKDVASVTLQMNELNKKSKIEPFCHPIELPRMKYFSSKDFVRFDSRKSAYDDLLKEIQDDKSNMIGLQGMGGSGKTTLVREVGKQVEELKLFDKVVVTVVSQDPKVRVIQGQIADQLSFKLEGETEFGRAQRLSQRLKTEKILIILDDVWKKLDLQAIGIQLNESNKNCKILLTTRKQEVCVSMGCQSITELFVLTEMEGWTLFKEYAQIADDSSEKLRVVARRIAKKCQGLLIAIVTVGSTLKGKSLDWWESSLSRLENCQPIDVPEGLTCPYACLKLSFDNLTNQLAKSLLLLCCMFPEDYEIHMEDLVRFGRGALQVPGLTNLGTMEKMRREFNVALNTLIDCCLLMRTNEKECVRMHDMVRDAALWIASNEGQATVVAVKAIPKEDETIKDIKVLSIWDLDKPKLPHQLLWPTVEILLHHSRVDGYEIPNGYLDGRKDLKVLALIAFSYRLYVARLYSFRRRPTLSIPQSIGSLNLQTLCLRGYQLGDISVLGSIKGLEILDLRGSSFIELPNEIGALNRLKLLDLYSCVIEKNNPYEVITRCSQLQELYITARGNYSLEDVSFPKLQRYCIWLSESDLRKFEELLDVFLKNCGDLRFLGVDQEGFYASALSESSIKDLYLRAEGLYLRQIHNIYKSIIPDMDKEHMNRLTSLTVQCCSGIKYLVDATTLVNTSGNSFDFTVIHAEPVFSELVYLRLCHMYDLEELFQDPVSSCSMKKLQRLQIEYCPQLYSISFPRNTNLCSLKILLLVDCPMIAFALFTPSIAQTLVVLKELQIIRCQNLNYITAEDVKGGNADDSSNQGKEHWLSSCQTNNPSTREIEISLPALTDLRLGKLPNLIGICPKHYRLRTIVWSVLWGVATTFNQLCNQVLPGDVHTFLNLKEIFIYSLDKLDGIFDLQVEEARCSNTNEEQTALKLSSNLHRLQCDDLSNLKFIWNGPANLLQLQSLQHVTLQHCPKLKTIFSATIVKCLPELTDLAVYDCNELEEIICLDSDAHSQQVCFPKLSKITIERCDKLKCIFSCSMACHCPSLQSLAVVCCSLLEQVVKFEHEAASEEVGGVVDHDDGKHALFPQLLELRLVTLPNLIGIFPRYEFKSHHKIDNCPKYSWPSIST